MASIVTRSWVLVGVDTLGKEAAVNPSAWGYLKPSQYCDVGRFFYRVFKF